MDHHLYAGRYRLLVFHPCPAGIVGQHERTEDRVVEHPSHGRWYGCGVYLSGNTHGSRQLLILCKGKFLNIDDDALVTALVGIGLGFALRQLFELSLLVKHAIGST